MRLYIRGDAGWKKTGRAALLFVLILLVILAGPALLRYASLGADATTTRASRTPTAPAVESRADASYSEVQPEIASALSTPTPDPQPTMPPALTAVPTPDPRKPLAGRRIGLDPGHGPRDDLGAVLLDPDTGRLVLSEAELDLDLALRCRDLLAARGADVVLTRESADTFTAPWPADANDDGTVGGASDDLQTRVDILNDFRAEVFVSIHANSSSDPAKRKGIQALYCATEDCAFPAESKRLGKLALDQLEAKLEAAGYPVQKRELRSDLWSDGPDDPVGHLFLLGPTVMPRHVRATRMPGVVAESLYVTSPAEASQLKKDAVRQAIALAYADALLEYLTGDTKK